jgi:CrcB protein
VNLIWVYVAVVAVFGGLGALLRFSLARWDGWLPWGILAANTVASLIVGFAGHLIANTDQLVLQVALVFGFAGGLSTFSSWAAQTGGFVEALKNRQAFLNAFLNLVLPVSAVFAGMLLGAFLLK